MPTFSGQNDLRNYARAAWRWRWLIVGVVVLTTVISFLVVHSKPKVYQSSTVIEIAQNNVNYTGSNATSAAEANNVVALAQILTTSKIANIAGKLLDPAVAGSQIGGTVSASANSVTNFITITTTANDPQRAANVATAYANALGAYLTSNAQSTLEQQITNLQSQIDHAVGANRAALVQQRDQLQADLGNQKLTQTLNAAVVNDTPISPHVRRTVEVGFFVGILLAIVVVLVLESLDRRLHSPEELEAATSLPLLATIPPTVFSGSLETGPIDEEAFQMLRTSISYFTTDRDLSTLLVVSPGEKEGKSTIASRLALTAANAGADVILADADLRRGGASKKFQIDSPRGLSAVLLGTSQLTSELVDWTLTEPGAGRLRILPSGPPPVNASALTSSEQMRRLLHQLGAMADLVVVDSPAALAVSDAVPLMRAVSGIVVVARMSQSGKDTVRRLLQIIDSAEGKVLGLVATGVGSHDAYYNYSNGYYSSSESGHHHHHHRSGLRKLLSRD